MLPQAWALVPTAQRSPMQQPEQDKSLQMQAPPEQL
jgi:hypothetical protein